MDLSRQFEQAVAASKTLTEKPSNETLLKLYSLYKQSTEGNSPPEGPANPFDIVGKAKHQAWQALNGLAPDDAKRQYIELVDSLLAG